MFTSKSSTRELSVEGKVARSASLMKCSTCLAPSLKVYPQSPSPTMVSYSVIVGSSLITLSQPAVMIFRTCESESWILDVPVDLVVGVAVVVLERGFVGLG